MPKNNTAIVVLNYLNYLDTIECVESILEKNYSLCGIVVVDNGSHNESLSELEKRFGSNHLITVISCDKNLGYAKGNNIGIKYAKNTLGAEFVLVVNNDTLFTDPEYINILLSKYKEGVGCIGSNILLKAGYYQGDYSENVSIKDCIYYFINADSLKLGSSFDFHGNRWNGTKMLHGAAILFAPDFFKYYEGFYPKTFLYGEEAILYYMCKCKKLEQVYVKETSIFHKEDQSSIMSFNNDSDIMVRYAYQSRKYVLLWALKSKWIDFWSSIGIYK